MHEPDTLGAEPLEEELGVTLPKDAFELIFVFIQDEFNAAATKLQKVYKSYHTRRYWADCAVVVEELWWKALDFAALKRSSVSFFDVEKQESAVSRWARARTRAAKCIEIAQKCLDDVHDVVLDTKQNGRVNQDDLTQFTDIDE
ncbi:hypothetical protein HN51_063598, partial [Arachis hypogaea]